MSMVGGERLALHRVDNGALNRRFVPGAGLDDYAGYYHGPRAAASTRRWLLADHQGSVVAYTDASAEAVVINTYDEYGRAGPANAERLQYTGQFTLSPGLDLIHYRNRFYNPRLGRFMQTDPTGYGDGLNLYRYVGNDPMNRVDPWGLNVTEVGGGVTITGVSCRMGWQCFSDRFQIEIFITQLRHSEPHLDGGGSGRVVPRPEAEDDCEHRNDSGQCVYRRDDDGNLELDEKYQEQVCDAYDSMMASNTGLA